MKRLLDESTDELTRSLLQAGAEHRPPEGNKRQLIVAMGAGGALGLFSSNAFAWLGTTAGKVTAAGVAVGVAGAVFVAGPLLRPGDTGGERAVSAARVEGDAARSEPLVEPPLPVSTPQAVAPAAAEDEAETEPVASAPVVPEPSALQPAAPSRRSSAAQRTRAREAGPRGKARTASQKSKRGPARKRAGAAATRAAPAQDVREVAPAAEARSAALDAEVRLVDQMRSAARRGDRAALARLVAGYRAEFPEGQLGKEVDDFEASLAQVTPEQ